MKNNNDFLVLDGDSVEQLLDFESGKAAVKRTYLEHAAGNTNLPHSVFLRPSEDSRIIGLPASFNGDTASPISGIKWVSSYPKNTANGFPRASAVILLNDYHTGYPICCMNASKINLFRTAASAYLVAETLSHRREPRKLGIIGCGEITKSFIDCHQAFDGIPFLEIKLYDLDRLKSEAMAKHINAKVSILDDPNELIKSSDVILLATTASKPYINDCNLLSHSPIILNLSLRDIHPDLILASTNIVDDLGHVNRELTSIHLTSSMVGNTDFVTGTVAGLLRKSFSVSSGKSIIFSPFGLGILDIAIAQEVFEKAKTKGFGTTIKNFIN